MNKPLDFPPPLNNELAQWILARVPGLEIPNLYEMCRYMHSQFPQFNEKSKLEVVDDYTVNRRYKHVDYGEMLYKPFKKPLPGLRNKWRRFVRRITPGYEEALRKRFPELANRYQSNDGFTYGSIPLPDAEFTRTIKMQRVGFHQRVDRFMMRDSSMPHFNGEFEFTAGYEPLTDTLYLFDKVWVTPDPSQAFESYRRGH